MGKPCAKQGDQIVAVDIHLYPGSPPVPGPHPYTGIIQMQTQPKINVMGMPAATQGTKSMNTPPHVPAVDGPTNIAEIIMGSTGVFFNNKMVARLGDIANTCQVSGPAPLGQVVCGGTVMAGEVGVAVVVVVIAPEVAKAAQMAASQGLEAEQAAAAAASALQAVLSSLGASELTESAAAAASGCSDAAQAVATTLRNEDPQALAEAIAQAWDAVEAANAVMEAIAKAAKDAELKRGDKTALYLRAALRAAALAAAKAARQRLSRQP